MRQSQRAACRTRGAVLPPKEPPPDLGAVPALKTAPGAPLTAATGLNTIGETSYICECLRAGYIESGRGIDIPVEEKEGFHGPETGKCVALA